MSDQQTQHEKHAWNTPMLMVLTRETGVQPPILTECKAVKRQEFNFANSDCRKGRSKYTCANMSCQNAFAS